MREARRSLRGLQAQVLNSQTADPLTNPLAGFQDTTIAINPIEVVERNLTTLATFLHDHGIRIDRTQADTLCLAA